MFPDEDDDKPDGFWEKLGEEVPEADCDCDFIDKLSCFIWELVELKVPKVSFSDTK